MILDTIVARKKEEVAGLKKKRYPIARRIYYASERLYQGAADRTLGCDHCRGEKGLAFQGSY